MEIKDINAKNILINVEKYIMDIEDGICNKYRIWDVCDELSIFDWWSEYLCKTQLKDMRKFLKEAIKLGYTGYVCFKVGRTGCANGMWALEICYLFLLICSPAQSFIGAIIFSILGGHSGMRCVVPIPD